MQVEVNTPLPPACTRAISPMSCSSWEFLEEKLQSELAPIQMTEIGTIRLPARQEVSIWELVAGSRIGMPTVIATNVALLALGFFLGRRSVDLDVSLGLVM